MGDFVQKDQVMIILGIDPGLSGGVAVLNDHAQLIEAIPMPVRAKTDTKMEMDGAALTKFIERHGTVIFMLVLERQRPMLAFRQSAQTGFSLGRSQGLVEGIVAALRIPLTLAEPQVWKKYYGLKGGKENKQLSRAKAAALYPTAPLDRKKDEGVAEAILIARWYVMKELIRT
jgi:crossover junction endodeoxyribonuclease RuvC